MSNCTRIKRIFPFSLSAILLVLLASACGKEKSQTHSDQFFLTLIKNPTSREASKWLTTVKNSEVGGGETQYSNSQSIKLVKDIYSSGALKVIAAKIKSSPYPGGGTIEYTDTLIITMPNSAAQRGRIFSIVAKHCQPEVEPEQEQGQKYLMLWWD